MKRIASAFSAVGNGIRSTFTSFVPEATSETRLPSATLPVNSNSGYVIVSNPSSSYVWVSQRLDRRRKPMPRPITNTERGVALPSHSQQIPTSMPPVTSIEVAPTFPFRPILSEKAILMRAFIAEAASHIAKTRHLPERPLRKSDVFGNVPPAQRSNRSITFLNNRPAVQQTNFTIHQPAPRKPR